MSDEKEVLAEIGKGFLIFSFVIIPGIILLVLCFDRMKDGLHAFVAFF